MRAAIFMILAIPFPFASAWSAANDSYAGQERRAIKALSDAEQADLLAGKGLGFAKAAELNGYPGPRHVLDLAAQLTLSPAQKAATEALFTNMQRRASALGAKIVETERSLDLAFKSGEIEESHLDELLERIATLSAELRGVHLKAHLEQAKLLSQEQVARYNALRGYSQATQEDHSGHAHHGH